MTIAALILASPALAQTPPAAPPAGSGNGGGVGTSTSTPRQPTGQTPPGAPGDRTVAGQRARNTVGQEVIGRTANAPGAVPGNTGARETGARPQGGGANGGH